MSRNDPNHEKQNLLQSVVWDYHVEPEGLLEVLEGKRGKAGPFDREKLFLRILERLPWHDILGLMGRQEVARMLTPALIKRLRIPEQRARYERIRKILQGEPVSFSGWNPAYREKYRRSLLSDRWYRTQPIL